VDDAAPWPCVDAVSDHTLLGLAVIPNARRTEAVGLHDGCLRVRLAAPALNGRANAALVAWLSAQLGLPKRGVVLLQGTSGRRKRVRLDCPEAIVVAWLERQPWSGVVI
jgi:uncharacterized protein (TIGR00251 family)